MTRNTARKKLGIPKEGSQDLSLKNEPPPPNQRELLEIEKARSRSENRRPRFTAKLDLDEDGSLSQIGPAHDDQDGWLARLEDMFGSTSREFALSQLNHILKVCQGSDGKFDSAKANGLLASIDGLKPSNEVEASLALQMAVTHELALQALARAKRADQLPQYDSAGGMAVRLLRTYTAQIEALTKLRRGGDSKEGGELQPILKVMVVDPVVHASFGGSKTESKGIGGGGEK